MTSDGLLARLLESIRARDLARSHEALVCFARAGGEQRTADAVLTAIRATSESEEEEDAIDEVRDFVVGYCGPALRIWPESTRR